MASTYGRQPAHRVLHELGYSYRLLACRLGLDACHMLRVLAGRVAPSHEVIEKLTQVTGLPASTLFTVKALEATYSRDNVDGRPARPLSYARPFTLAGHGG